MTRTVPAALWTIGAVGCALLSGCNSGRASSLRTSSQGTAAPPSEGQAVFRFETFGNEGFWTDAMRVPEGMKAARVTPLQALQLGISVNVDSIDDSTRQALAEQLRADPTGKSSRLLNDPAVVTRLLNANAILGLPVKDANGDGMIDIEHGDKVGVTCALCHTITDGSAFSLKEGGSIGHPEDGRTNHNLHVGAILATAANTRALYPLLQLALTANKGKTYGRARKGLTEQSTEAEVDAYLRDEHNYPVGMFDDSPDGNGDPMHIVPFFRQDLAAPFGSAGSFAKLEDFNNLVYTGLLDPTDLTTPGGRAFLELLGGKAGAEIADDYVSILRETHVTGYPFVRTAPAGKPGSQEGPLGRRVDQGKLDALSDFLESLPAPPGVHDDAQAIAHGRELFESSGCTRCHFADQGKPVRDTVLPMKSVFPGDHPVMLAQRKRPLNPIMDTPDNIFDDKMAVVNASVRGGIRGLALPLLLDLARKPVFLHDNSVTSLEHLLTPARGATAPHAFFVSSSADRADLVAFLRSLDTGGGN